MSTSVAITEIELFWRFFAALRSDAAAGAVVFFGAGQFMRRWLAVVGERFAELGQTWITDENCAPTTLAGQPVCHPSQVTGAVRLLVLATDTIPDRLMQRSLAYFSAEIPRDCLAAFQTRQRLRRLDQAMPGDLQLIPPEHRQPGRRLEGILVSVGYGKTLARTLPHNLRHFDRLVVVSAPEDTTTHAVVKQYGAELVICDTFRRNGCFNKGILLNAGMAKLSFNDWLLITDADIILPPDFRAAVLAGQLDTHALYCATRLNAPAESTDAWLERLAQCFDAAVLELPCDAIECAPFGYFQLVNAAAPVVVQRRTALFSEVFLTAGGVDYEFHCRWPVELKRSIQRYVVHLPHGALGEAWTGEQHNGPANEQCTGWQPIGYFFHRSQHYRSFRAIPGTGTIRITRSDTAQMAVGAAGAFTVVGGVGLLAGPRACGVRQYIEAGQERRQWLWEGMPSAATDFEVAWRAQPPL